jgi:hypothetical protein
MMADQQAGASDAENEHIKTATHRNGGKIPPAKRKTEHVHMGNCLYRHKTTSGCNNCLIKLTLSRLLDKPSFAAILQGVYFIFYTFLPLHLSALVVHLQAEYIIILGSYLTQRIRCFVLLGLIYCICLANTVVIFLICVCEGSKLGQITSLLNLKTLKC